MGFTGFIMGRTGYLPFLHPHNNSLTFKATCGSPVSTVTGSYCIQHKFLTNTTFDTTGNIMECHFDSDVIKNLYKSYDVQNNNNRSEINNVNIKSYNIAHEVQIQYS